MDMINKKFIALMLAFVFAAFWGNAQTGPGKNAYKQAEAYRKSKQYNEAVQKYDEAIKLEPNNARYYYKKGYCQIRQQPPSVDGAIESFNQAINNKKDYSEAYAALGKIYYNDKLGKKDIARAIQNFNSAFKYEQDNGKKVNYKLMVVKILMKEQRFSEARGELQEAKSLAPDDPQIMLYEGQIAGGLNNWSEALNIFKKAVDRVKGLPATETDKYYFALGEAQWRTGDTKGAEETWKQVQAPNYQNKIKKVKNSNNPAGPFRIAMGYFKVDEMDEAMSYLKKSLELSQNYAPAHQLMGMIYYKKGQNSLAIQSLMKAVENQSDENKKAKLYNTMVKIQMNSGDYSGALSTANKILEKTNNNNIRFLKAKAEYKLGQYPQAISTLEALLPNEADPNKKAPYNFVMGLAAKKSGNIEKATKAFKDAQYGPYKAAAKKELENISKK
jgi:tetratricopeptide (TPR) repeat protein